MSERAPPRLFIDADLRAGIEVALANDQSHYLANVMRRGAGDPVLVFNGSDGEWLARIAGTSRRAITLDIVERTRPQDAPCDLWLVFAPIKRQRVDFIAEKGAELGVSRLMPVLTRHTHVERVNVERLRAHAIEAAEQCGILNVPAVAEPRPLGDVIAAWPGERRLLFCDEDGTSPAALGVLTGETGGPWAVLIGPEGGFDPGERIALRDLPAARPVSLGPRIMRADTAAVAALALFQAALGDWR